MQKGGVVFWTVGEDEKFISQLDASPYRPLPQNTKHKWTKHCSWENALKLIDL